MSAKLKAQITVELSQLEQLLAQHHPLLLQAENRTPDSIERLAIAALLHSYYTGVENIFRRIALELDDGVPSGAKWHRDLLDTMRSPTAARPAVISDELHSKLAELLQFRHVFRQAYSFQLRWEKMQPLVIQAPDTLRLLREQLAHWTATMPEDS